MLGGEPELSSAVIVVLPAVLEHKPQAASAKQRTFFAAGDSELPTFYFSSAVRYSLSGLARIPRVDYKRKPNMTSFLSQLKQRRVYRVAIGYAIVAWLMVQIAATVLPALHAPEFVLPVLIVMLGGGFRTQLRWRGLFK